MDDIVPDDNIVLEVRVDVRTMTNSQWHTNKNLKLFC